MTAQDQPRTVLVVGASSGIQSRDGPPLATEGANLVLASRSEQALKQTRQECVSRGAGDVLVPRPTSGTGRPWSPCSLRRSQHTVGSTGSSTPPRWSPGSSPRSPPTSSTSLQTNVTGAANVGRSALQHFADESGGSLVVGLGPGQDRNAVHEPVHHQQVGDPRPRPHPADRGAGDPRRPRQPDLPRRGQHPRLRPGRQLHRASGAPRRRRSPRRSGSRATW